MQSLGICQVGLRMQSVSGCAIGGSERSEPEYFLFRYADEFEYAGSNVNSGPSETW